MTASPPRAQLQTHEVFNQPGPFAGRNLYLTDPALRDAVRREAGDWLDGRMTTLGAALGTEEALGWGETANRFSPELKQFDRYGRRLDEAVFHPAYHSLMSLAMESGIHDVAWTDPGPAPHAGHAAMLGLFTGAEAGTMCPINMTYAAVPALRTDPEVGGPWLAKLIGGIYDAPLRPIAGKAGITMGMAMTEKQGGSDVRANTTKATPLADGGYALTGHKWFCSAPMCDGFLTLAYLDGGLTCFVVPRVLPDGTRNAIQVMRLKDKLGNKSNASSEIEYHGAWAERLGEPGRGVNTIIEMVHHTRLGTISGTVGIMRMALAQALHHCGGRSVFQRRLVDQPVMRRVLADLQVEYEAAVALVLHIAARFDAPSAEGRAYARLAVALAKYLLTKRCANFVYECMECLGGAGYVEEGPMPRLYREAPLNAIWEGSGNVIALDVMRTLGRAPEALEAFTAELRGADPALAEGVGALFAGVPPAEGDARHVAERMALALQAAVLREAPGAVSDAFRATRLGGAAATYGASGARVDVDAIMERAVAA